MPNLSEIIIDIRDIILEPDPENSKWNNKQLKRYANEGYFDISSKVKQFVKPVLFPGGTVIDQVEYVFTGEIVDVTDVIIDTHPADPQVFREVQRLISLQGATLSTFGSRLFERKYYLRRDNNTTIIGIFPVFKEAGKEFKILTVELPPLLVEETDTPLLRLDLHRLISFYAGWRALESEDKARADRFKAIYDNELEKEIWDEQNKQPQHVIVVGEP